MYSPFSSFDFSGSVYSLCLIEIKNEVEILLIALSASTEIIFLNNSCLNFILDVMEV